MKILHVIFHVLGLIALVILTVLISTEILTQNKIILAYILIGFIAVALIWKGRRDFGYIIKTIK